jgi:hypothetical protein
MAHTIVHRVSIITKTVECQQNAFQKARSEKNQLKISFFTTSEKENPWSEDETDTGTTTEANEPIEVDDDVSHEASENKDRWASLYTWLTYNNDKNKMYCSKCIKVIIF